MDLNFIKQVGEWLQQAGLVGLLAVIILGGYRRWWVWGYQLEKSEREAEAWKDLALRNSNIADNSLLIATRKSK